MEKLLILILLLFMINPITIFDFSKNSDISNWIIVDDVVMGGESSGKFEISPAGSGLFSGKVSLENNGGFSSVQYRFKTIKVSTYSKFVIHLKGDGKRYQFRVKARTMDYQSYVCYIQTGTDWETIEIPFSKLYPSFRGRKLNQPNFPGEIIEGIGFLFGNKKAESFKLEIDKIELKE